ncbi:MAG TPA: histidine--tRNA ligase [Acidimicrobiales bacterium]|nr:histidine--tRNA ligase [Acidimicrobiales bacterium]
MASTEDQGTPRAPKGTKDTLWPESARWEALVARFAHRAHLGGFGLVVNPTFEEVRLFRRGVGETTEVVSKEMYEFTDRGGRALALRPEGTAPVVRAFIEHRPPVPWKAWYLAPSFRYERAQAGRYRQHHQVGVEALGTEDPDLDVEVVALAAGFLVDLGLASVTLLVNSIGDKVCRPAYVELLRAYLRGRRGELCDEHRERFEANPLRVLDCKTRQCRAVAAEAPVIVDHLCDPCAAHHARVLEGLRALGVAFEPAPHLVRGLDYYTRTAFEFVSTQLEAAQVTVCGGGRYDGLVEQLGGPPTPGIGFGAGIERVLLACDAEGVFGAAPAPPAAFVVDLVDGRAARDLVAELRGAGLGAERAYDGRSLKAQLKLADRSAATVALIVGADEAAAGTVTLRPLRGEGEQRQVPRGEVVAEVGRLAGGRHEERGTP